GALLHVEPSPVRESDEAAGHEPREPRQAILGSVRRCGLVPSISRRARFARERSLLALAAESSPWRPWACRVFLAEGRQPVAARVRGRRPERAISNQEF